MRRYYGATVGADRMYDVIASVSVVCVSFSSLFRLILTGPSSGGLCSPSQGARVFVRCNDEQLIAQNRRRLQQTRFVGYAKITKPLFERGINRDKIILIFKRI